MAQIEIHAKFQYEDGTADPADKVLKADASKVVTLQEDEVSGQNGGGGSSDGVVPIGCVVAYLKSYTNAPSLPTQFVECNGQTLSDSGSVFNGQTIPNLNASGSGTKRFLRGSTSSGTTGGSETHTHSISSSSGFDLATGGTDSLILTTSTDAASTLPSYYEVVWVMRIK